MKKWLIGFSVCLAAGVSFAGWQGLKKIDQLNIRIGKLTTENTRLKRDILRQKQRVDNAYQTINIFDRIAGANINAKNNIMDKTEKARTTINNTPPTKSYFDQPLPAAAVNELRRYADSL